MLNSHIEVNLDVYLHSCQRANGELLNGGEHIYLSFKVRALLDPVSEEDRETGEGLFPDSLNGSKTLSQSTGILPVHGLRYALC